MKKWNNAEIVSVEIEETANGGNEHAVEANTKNPNPDNGVGGRVKGEKSEVTTTDRLS